MTENNTAPHSTSSRSVLGIFFLIIFLFFIFIVFAFLMLGKLSFNSDHAGMSLLDVKNSPVAVIEIEGPIMESQKIVDLLLEAEEDASVKAIILRIDSPGGAVGPTQEIYDEVIRLDKIKPVYASFGSLAASGGYYIGSAARKIFASAGTLTGSIGVIMEFMDFSKLFDFAKVKPQTLKAGKYKDIGSPSRAMTEEEGALMNSLLEETRQRFMSDVLRKRKDKIHGNMNEIAQGQVFSGEQAVKIGLVDEIAGLWEAARIIKKELKLKDGTQKLRFLKPKKEFSWQDFLSDVQEGATWIKMLMSQQNLPLYFWSSHH